MPPRTPGRFIERILHLPYSTLGVLWVWLVLLFAGAYFSLHEWLPAHGPASFTGTTSLERLGDAIYYSIITATTVGYGDIIPMGLSKVLASIQAIIAFLLFGICIGKIVSGKQEIALEQIQRLIFEDVFRSIREGLFIARKDLDHAIAAVEHNAFGKHHWDNLGVAYKQVRMLVGQIPEFYRDDDLCTIDPAREQLLQEAVHRTLHRLNQLLDALSAGGIDWIGQLEIASELGHLVDSIERVTPLWKGRSPHNQHEAFEDILRQSRMIKGKTKEAVQ